MHKPEKDKNTNIAIGVAMHKPYPLPKGDIYMPIHVGAALHPGVLTEMQGDDTGENISELNPYFSELTALYWLWKNNSSAYKGLVHYRRYFTTRNILDKHNPNRFRRVIQETELREALQEYSVLLPKKRHYVIETIKSHYVHTMHGETLKVTEDVLQDISPEYLPQWHTLMNRRSEHIYNMMVMNREHFDAYCEWLFPILFELTKRLDPSKYEPFHARYPGRISEMLLNVWIMKNKVPVGELPTSFMEHIDWWKKGTSFLKAKFLKQKYTRSF